MLFIVAAVVPLIVRWAEIPIPPELIHYRPAGTARELFAYHKSWVLAFCAVAIIFQAISEQLIRWPDSAEIKQKVKTIFKYPVVIMTAVYLFFVLLSNILSPYTHTALWGFYDRREGLFIQTAYMTVFLATFFYVKEKKDTRILLAGLLVSSLIMGAIGFGQFIGRDFFTTPLAFQLVVGQHSDIDYLRPDFVMSYGTSFNPNTFGLITAMLFPLLFAAAVDSSNRVLRILFLLAGGLMFIGIIGSRSVGGFIGAGTAIAMVAVVLAFRRQKVSRTALIALPVILALTAGAGLLLRGQIYEHMSFTIGRIAAIFQPPITNYPTFSVEGTSVTVTDRGITYQIIFPAAPGSPEIAGSTPVGEQRPGGVTRYIHEVPGLGNVEILREDSGDLSVYLYRGILWTVENGRLYILYFGDTLIDPSVSIPSWGFEGWETWGSNRGFIFARTIPLLPQFWFIGSGSDTFILQFPNHDVISKLQYFDDPYILVDKAHNLYLQTAVTTGWISAFALIALFGCYIVTTFLSLLRTKENFWLRLGILASVSAFSVSSLSTDSTVSSTPMFWIIIGMGYALNKIQLAGKAGQLKQ